MEVPSGGSKIPLESTHKVRHPVDVELIHAVSVPARSELDILVKTRVHVEDGGTWLMEEKSNCKQKFLVARAVVSLHRDTVVVHLLNPHSEGVTLHGKTKIAELTELDAVSIVSSKLYGKEETCSLSDGKQQMLQEMVDSCGSDLTPEEQEEFFELLLSYGDTFAGPGGDLGRTDKLMHTIFTGEAQPIRQGVRRIPLARKAELTKLVQGMLDKDVISRSSSPWAAPVVLVQKKDGTYRFCVDYRKLNSVTRKDAYPLPRIDDTLDMLHGSQWFSTLDLASGYWQVEMAQEDQHRTAFAKPEGLFEFKVMPFGLCNAPATFQRLMDLVLAGLVGASCLVYLDDIIILGEDFHHHLKNIQSVLQRIREAGLKLQPPKCYFFKQTVGYLGHTVSREGVAVDPDKVAKVKNWSTPHSAREVQQFLGLANYYRRFIQDFATKARPLHHLTEKSVHFWWTAECQEAFDTNS